MRFTDNSSLLDLINKFWSWVYWGTTFQGFEIEMQGGNSCQISPDHDRSVVGSHNSIKYHCRGCGQVFCEMGIQGSEPVVLDMGCVRPNQLDDAISIKCCKFCGEVDVRRCEGKKKNFEKVHPRESPEPPSPCFSVSEKITDSSMNCESIRSDSMTSFFEAEGHNHLQTSSSMNSFSAHPSPVSVGRSPSRYRSDEEMGEDSDRLFFSPSIEHCHNIFDIGKHSFSSRRDFYYRSVGSSPSDSPSRIGFISNRGGHTVQQEKDGSPISRDVEPETIAVLLRRHKATEDAENSDYCSDDMSVFQAQYEKSQKQMDFENSGSIWSPPPPNDEDDEGESNYFQYDDDDDDVGDSAAMFSSSSSLSSIFPAKERQQDATKEPLRALVQAHFRALVSQLLHGEGIKMIEENRAEEWIDVVTSIAWQAANFVKPDTSKGGSMDPCDYVKVKCVASGSPSGSAVVKGVVCTKNIKHKRMTSQYKNPRILILGGSLEYQRAQNELASFNTLLQQEIDHLKMIISKIEALHPNVLLVEKSVSSYAQEYLLEKEISLVLNVKRPLLERISKCTGATINPSIESISTTRLGHCELFRLERVSEEHEFNSQSSKKQSKTLMFFEGCPRRLGCTVLLRGACREELKKVKHVVLYAVFAAYHLSLETSFLADEGASLPKMNLKLPIGSEKAAAEDGAISNGTASAVETQLEIMPNAHASDDPGVDSSEIGGLRTNFKHSQPSHGSSITGKNEKLPMTPFGAHYVDPFSPDSLESYSHAPFKNIQNFKTPSESRNVYHRELLMNMTAPELRQPGVVPELDNCERIEGNGMSSEYFSATDTNQSILVSFSSRCVLKGTVCERSRLLRIKFYGCFDKPLGKYLRDDLFDQTSYCRSCKEPAEVHVLCYTHQQGNLTVNVKHIPSMKLAGEVDGKIWMWHRCLKCAHVNGVPPATRRVVMSDAAWGLSFGKFLELSFSNHATANRVATCGHSLQRDCLRYYGFGSMVAFFRYSPINILSVCLPPSMLEFNGYLQQEWLRKEVIEMIDKMETLYQEISEALERVEQKSTSFGHELLHTSDLRNYIAELKDLLKKEKTDYNDLLDLATIDSSESGQSSIDILELNRLQQSLLIGSNIWNRRLYSLDLLVETKSPKDKNVDTLGAQIQEWRIDLSVIDGVSDSGSNCNDPASSNVFDDPANGIHSGDENPIIKHNGTSDEEITRNTVFSETLSSDEPNLSERIDSAWTGSDQVWMQNQSLHIPAVDGLPANAVGHISGTNSPTSRRLKSPLRVNSFDSALRLQERLQRAMLPSSIHLTTLGSFHASGDYRHMLRDPLRYSVSNIMRTYSQMWPRDAYKLNALSSAPAIISSASLFTASARLLLPQTGHNDIVIAVYDDEPTSVISYALSSKEYDDWVSNKLNEHGGDLSSNQGSREGVTASFSTWQSFGTMDLDNIPYANYGSDDVTSSVGALFREPKKSPNLRISFEDESSSAGGKVKFSVTCYFAKQFDSLREKCCPCELDFIRSLSRCKRWSAEGGKSNVYFAKSMDERFIIKQVTKTELDSFVEFAPEYFKYLNDSLSLGSPTCLAKILGLYQVTVKHVKGSKETKMDLMVMENLFFKRSISWTYDLKGSARGRYNPDTSGKNKVLWDMNLLESLHTKPIFLGSKAKRRLERAIWNDTAFLASVDVMDYSLLVGVDEERQELVLGIIDFMRQYTWDKHLETWVKASGILGGPKNASPTIISPKQYKKRFRKAMTSYFLTVPDQWSS